MTDLFPNVPLQMTRRAAFTLPCPTGRATAYLSDPAVLFGALPSVERVIARRQGTFRLVLAPIPVPGYALRPAAEVAIVTGAERVTVRSIAAMPADLQAGEIQTEISGFFALAAMPAGCAVRAALSLGAEIPTHVLPRFMPRAIAARTVEALLMPHLTREVSTLTRELAHGFLRWEREGTHLTE